MSADIGNTLIVSVTATNGSGSSSPATSAATSTVTAAGGVPANLALPSVSGVMQAGNTLTGATGAWTNSPTSFTYQWFTTSGGPPARAVSGKNSSTYALIEGTDNGHELAIQVTASNSAGASIPTLSPYSAQIDWTGDTVPVCSAAPVLSSTAPQQGIALTTTNGTWTNSPASFTYQWLSSGIALTTANYWLPGGPIPGATSSSYTPAAGDVGNKIAVAVTASNGSGPSVSGATSAPTFNAVIASTGGAVPVNSVLPAISGTAQVGQTLTTTNGTWTNSPASFTYVWNRAGTPISGATASTYVPVPADVGNKLTSSVTAINGSGSSTPATSAATSAVIAAGGLAISGTAQVGQTLTASGGSGGYQWYREGSPVSGATASAYPLKTADLGCLIQVASGGVFSALSTPVIGTTVFYVSQSGGNDSNPGTLAQPWKTLAKVNGASLPPGTSVLFKRGDTWPTTSVSNGTDQLLLPESGAAGNPIVYDAYGAGAKPIFSGAIDASTASAWTNIGGNIWVSVQSFPPPSGGFRYNNGNDIGNIIWGTYPGTISVGVTSHAAMAGQSDSNIRSQGQWYFNFSDWKVHVFSAGNPATAMPGLRLAMDKSAIVCDVLNNCIIQNLDLRYFAGSGIIFELTQLSNLILRDLTIAYCGGGNNGGAPGAVRFGDAFDIEGPADNVLVERCWFDNIYDAGPTIQPQFSVNVSNITYRNNVVRGAPQGIFQLFGPVNLSNILFYNNTADSSFSWCEGQRWGDDGSSEDGQNWTWYLPGGLSGSNIQWKNNVFSNIGSFGILGPSLSLGNGSLTSDYNLWHNADGSAPVFAATDGSGNFPMTQWANNHSPKAETHGLIGVDPKFTNEASRDYAPASGSPLLGAGVNLAGSGVVWDINKKPRPASGAFTIGAYQ
ncbi:MAG: hypothetical protein M3Z96_13495 [Pseudomonadota bacterium]|nr:hypothetical protein [Pseudomonadota bacterium]